MISETWGVGMYMYLRAIGFKHALMGVSAAAQNLCLGWFVLLHLHFRPGNAITESRTLWLTSKPMCSHMLTAIRVATA